MDNSSSAPAGTRTLDRRILALALPTFATLVSEPLLLLADSAIVGHLGTEQLAALGLSANVLGVLTGLSIFLAYGTTGTVARRIGAGDPRAALAGGIDGLVLAVALGVVLTLALELALPVVVGLYGTSPEVAGHATTYLRIAALACPRCCCCWPAPGCSAGCRTPGPRWSSSSRPTWSTSPSTCSWSTASASASPAPRSAR